MAAHVPALQKAAELKYEYLLILNAFDRNSHDEAQRKCRCIYSERMFWARWISLDRDAACSQHGVPAHWQWERELRAARLTEPTEHLVPELCRGGLKDINFCEYCQRVEKKTTNRERQSESSSNSVQTVRKPEESIRRLMRLKRRQVKMSFGGFRLGCCLWWSGTAERKVRKLKATCLVSD